jgi:hypothetical protein
VLHLAIETETKKKNRREKKKKKKKEMKGKGKVRSLQREQEMTPFIPLRSIAQSFPLSFGPPRSYHSTPGTISAFRLES